MSSLKRQKTRDKRQETGAVRQRKSSYCLLLFAGCLVFVSGCRMDMQDQPKYKAYRKGSIRKLVDGTVPRGYLREDKQLYTGKKDQPGAVAGPVIPPQSSSLPQQTGAPNLSPSAMYPDAVDSFPFPITEEIVKRGEDRYNIFCGLCHGPTGYGDGMIIRRGFRRRPPSYHTDALRQAPVGHFYDVITNGWGVMSSYSSMIPVTDRWAIVAYIRALQLSQNPQGATSASSTPAMPKPSPAPSPATRGRR